MAPLFGYWNIRGLGQYARLLLEYTGTEYEENRYLEDSQPSWPMEKFKLGLDFPNLPYYKDGDLKLTQSNAILYYIGRKHDMVGTTDEEKAHVDMLVNQATDMRLYYALLVYFDDFEAKRESYLTDRLRPALKMLSEYLADKSWIMGDKITIADFMLYETLDVHLHLEKTCLDDFKNLQDYHKRFEELPAIKSYMESPRFIKYPINTPMAKFGGK